MNVEGALGKWRKIRSMVNQWLVEFYLNEWINKINHTAGVAPSFDSVFEKYRCLRQETNMPEDRYDRYDSRKKWVQRYMQKWSASRKSIVTHEANSTAEVVKKVRPKKKQKKTHSRDQFVFPFWGSFFGPKIGTMYKNGKRNGVQKTAPKLGPQILGFGVHWGICRFEFLGSGSGIC